MKKYSQETIVGIFVVLGIVCIGYMTVKLGNVGFFGDDTYSLTARFNKVTGLKLGNPVSIMGLEVGKVTDFKMDQEALLAVVTMRIDKDVKIYDDAIASIKTEGLIGDKYIDIDPGGGGDLLGSGAQITETESPIDIGELIGKYAFGDAEK
jgi:phospholipid/cholesterol/gamma-HCH transport system substrate-binding protein